MLIALKCHVYDEPLRVSNNRLVQKPKNSTFPTYILSKVDSLVVYNIVEYSRHPFFSVRLPLLSVEARERPCTHFRRNAKSAVFSALMNRAMLLISAKV